MWDGGGRGRGIAGLGGLVYPGGSQEKAMLEKTNDAHPTTVSTRKSVFVA